MTNQTILVTGNTYPVKDAIKALGGRWDANANGWRVPADRAAEAQSLVASAPAPTRRKSSGRRSYGRSSGSYGPVDRYGQCHCAMCSSGSECLCPYGNG